MRGVGAGGGGEPVGAGRTGHGGAGEDEVACSVAGFDAPGGVVPRGEAYAEPGGAGGVHGDVPPGGGQDRCGGLLGGRGEGERGLQERRVEAEARRVGVRGVGKCDLGEDVDAGAPQGAHRIEGGCEVEAAVLGEGARRGGVGRDGVGGRPGSGSLRGGGGPVGEVAGRVPRPGGGGLTGVGGVEP